MTERNRRLVLAQRPTAMIDSSTVRLEDDPVPEPGPGQALVRVRYLSIDPTDMRVLPTGTDPPSALNVFGRGSFGRHHVAGRGGAVKHTLDRLTAAGEILRDPTTGNRWRIIDPLFATWLRDGRPN